MGQIIFNVCRPVNNLRFVVEVNRNYCLIFGFVGFVFVADLPLIVSNDVACTVVTFVNHLAWTCVFTWTGLEGYMLYKAVVVVFDTGSHRCVVTLFKYAMAKAH